MEMMHCSMVPSARSSARVAAWLMDSTAGASSAITPLRVSGGVDDAVAAVAQGSVIQLGHQEPGLGAAGIEDGDEVVGLLAHPVTFPACLCGAAGTGCFLAAAAGASVGVFGAGCGSASTGWPSAILSTTCVS